ncbi:hypothetical protein [Pelagibius marinus]|uniref:hypothetical protein n=1 Tax=Pelagibius marinus TaxID=2762760 RepID=UPI001872A52E|nr:hypothetical protein [Pelagibius marinus]
MSPALERDLIERYPKLFADYGAAPDKSAMAFGFECGNGWFDLLDALCAQLSKLKPAGESDDPLPLTALQVKEKYGTLRFYLGACSDEVLALVELAEAMSAGICETCGNRGRTRGMTWLKTLCSSCAREQGYAETETEAP